MCGIAGVLRADDAEALTRRLCSQISHRGPDAEGVVGLHPSSALGHRRLSIIDTASRSDQPFIRDGLTLVYNGEVYNFRELRDELAADVQFTTSSDTEVVLEAWRKWGVGCLRRLRGMFAFAIHDARDGSTTLVRDAFGIKPLFWMPRQGGGVAFSSELKALAAVFRSEMSPDLSALMASLCWVWIPEEHCAWQPARKLSPGSWMRIAADGQRSTGRYWEPGELRMSASMSDEACAVSKLDSVLEASVKAHLVSDVPVNAFLSGGLDSSLLVAMARRHLGRFDTYCLRFGADAKRAEGMADDAFYAERVAKELDVGLNLIDARPDMAELLPRIVEMLDEPIGDSAAVASFLICDAARRNGVKVLLSGMGADELFGGYRKHHACLIADKYRRVPKPFRWMAETAVGRLPVSGPLGGIRTIRWAKRFLSFASLPESAAFMRSYSYLDAAGMERLGGTKAREVFAGLVADHEATYSAAGTSADLVNRMCLTDLQRFMVSLNETYTDRTSMAASTEVRVPFIDHDVVSAAFSIPGRLKVKAGVSKYVLKRVAEKWLPSDVIYRPKSSFTLPLRAWIRGELAEMVNDRVVSTSGLAGRGWLDAGELRKIVERDRAGREDNAQLIWQFLTIEQWFRNNGI